MSMNRIGIIVELIRASDGVPYPDFEINEFADKDRFNSRAIRVSEGDNFFPRITITRNFAWYNANVLEVTVNYDKARPWRREHYFQFPRTAKPETPEPITVDLRYCPIKRYTLGSWQACSAQFRLTKVCFKSVCLFVRVLKLTLARVIMQSTLIPIDTKRCRR